MITEEEFNRVQILLELSLGFSTMKEIFKLEKG
jgi:hypothetical protein